MWLSILFFHFFHPSNPSNKKKKTFTCLCNLHFNSTKEKVITHCSCRRLIEFFLSGTIVTRLNSEPEKEMWDCSCENWILKSITLFISNSIRWLGAAAALFQWGRWGKRAADARNSLLFFFPSLNNPPLLKAAAFATYHFLLLITVVVLWATSPKFEVSPFYWLLCCHFSKAPCGVWRKGKKIKGSVPWRHEVQSDPCRFRRQHPGSRSVSWLIWQVVESKHPKPNCINIWNGSMEPRLWTLMADETLCLIPIRTQDGRCRDDLFSFRLIGNIGGRQMCSSSQTGENISASATTQWHWTMVWAYCDRFWLKVKGQISDAGVYSGEA